ncbi:MAG: molybdopterin molybdotransferase MoeA [Gammaproteobacteria bacterium]|nr:molybdopterin molybdotransferase MoeA [Gammaproteobacteria bacterium]
MTEFTFYTEPSCDDDSDPSSLPIDSAQKKILSGITTVSETESIILADSLGRVLSEDIIAGINVPAQANSAMDGYAISSSDIPKDELRELKLIGTSWAGRPFTDEVNPGECVRIMTGGVLPEGTDTVVMQEHVQIKDEMIFIDSRAVKSDHVRPVGEDICKGDTIIQANTQLTAAHIGLIASLGTGSINVYRKLKVAYFLTGDELRSIGESLEPGQIYDSNSYTLSAMLDNAAIEIYDLGIVRDDKQTTQEVLENAAKLADIVITTGGVSVGEADYVKDALETLGEVSFWKVAMKPGRPLAFGKVGKAAFFGLPGNPVSAMVTFYQFVLPALNKAMGNDQILAPTFKVTCLSNLKKRPGRVEYQRGILSRDQSGEILVSKTGEQGSGILSSMAKANCFIILPLENDGVVAGETVEVQPFYGIM